MKTSPPRPPSISSAEAGSGTGEVGTLLTPSLTSTESSAAFGVDPDAKEAIAFAVLGHQTLHGLPGNLPRATGARGPRLLGTIAPVGKPPAWS